VARVRDGGGGVCGGWFKECISKKVGVWEGYFFLG